MESRREISIDSSVGSSTATPVPTSGIRPSANFDHERPKKEAALMKMFANELDACLEHLKEDIPNNPADLQGFILESVPGHLQQAFFDRVCGTISQDLDAIRRIKPGDEVPQITPLHRSRSNLAPRRQSEQEQGLPQPQAWKFR